MVAGGLTSKAIFVTNVTNRLVYESFTELVRTSRLLTGRAYLLLVAGALALLGYKASLLEQQTWTPDLTFPTFLFRPQFIDHSNDESKYHVRLRCS